METIEMFTGTQFYIRTLRLYNFHAPNILDATVLLQNLSVLFEYTLHHACQARGNRVTWVAECQGRQPQGGLKRWGEGRKERRKGKKREKKGGEKEERRKGGK